MIGRKPSLGHLLLLAVIVGTIMAYILDARSVSLKADNLILVQPLSILALILAAIVLRGVLSPRAKVTTEVEPEQVTETPETATDLIRVFILIGALGFMAFFLENVGFDVATFIFMVVGLLVCGERRWWVVLGFSAIFTVVLIYGYGTITPFPFPLTVL